MVQRAALFFLAALEVPAMFVAGAVASRIGPEAIGDEEFIELATMVAPEEGDRLPEDLLALRDDLPGVQHQDALARR